MRGLGLQGLRLLGVGLTAAVALLCHSPVKAEILVAAIGDSNIAGYGVSSSDNYPSKLERALKAKGLDVRVVNSGINGNTTLDVLARLDSAAPSGTKVAVVWVGIQDFKKLGAKREEIRGRVGQIVGQLKQKGIAVYVITPTVDQPLRQNLGYVLSPSDRHFNAAGYDALVARTLAPVQALVAKGRRS